MDSYNSVRPDNRIGTNRRGERDRGEEETAHSLGAPSQVVTRIGKRLRRGHRRDGTRSPKECLAKDIGGVKTSVSDVNVNVVRAWRLSI